MVMPSRLRESSMLQNLIDYCSSAGGIYLYTHDSLLSGILLLLAAIGVLWGASKGTRFYIPLQSWLSIDGGTTGNISDECGGGGDGSGGDWHTAP